eukprot:6868949-Prymnesium_polylepis.7
MAIQLLAVSFLPALPKLIWYCTLGFTVSLTPCHATLVVSPDRTHQLLPVALPPSVCRACVRARCSGKAAKVVKSSGAGGWQSMSREVVRAAPATPTLLMATLLI